MPDLSPTYRAADWIGRDSVSSTVLENTKTVHRLMLAIQRELGGARIRITSAYRSVAENARVGGVATSQHVTGSAADFTVPGRALADVARALHAAILAGRLVVGQLVYYPGEADPGEDGQHIHVGLPNGSYRNAELVKTPTGYAPITKATWPAYAAGGAFLVGLILVAVIVWRLQEGNA